MGRGRETHLRVGKTLYFIMQRFNVTGHSLNISFFFSSAIIIIFFARFWNSRICPPRKNREYYNPANITRSTVYKDRTCSLLETVNKNVVDLCRRFRQPIIKEIM